MLPFHPVFLHTSLSYLFFPCLLCHSNSGWRGGAGRTRPVAASTLPRSLVWDLLCFPLTGELRPAAGGTLLWVLASLLQPGMTPLHIDLLLWGIGGGARDTCCRCFGRGRASLSVSGEEREEGKKWGRTLSAEENFRLQWRGNIGSRYEETLRQGLDFRWRLCWPPGDRSRVPSSRFKYQHQDLMTMIA